MIRTVGPLWLCVVLATAACTACIKENNEGQADSKPGDAASETSDKSTTTATTDTATAEPDSATATDTAITSETTATETTNGCGNGTCDDGETRLLCATDCFCGNGTCDVAETRGNCAEDCGCGNGICDGPESKLNCAADCCAGVECNDCACDTLCGESVTNCPKDCSPEGDGIVSPGEVECGRLLDACTCVIGGLYKGAGCGDGCCIGYLCGETPGNCAQDCGSGCGNTTCDPGETPYTCEQDCVPQACGNGTCEGPGENVDTCPADCGNSCGNCECDSVESYLNRSPTPRTLRRRGLHQLPAARREEQLRRGLWQLRRPKKSALSRGRSTPR